MNHKVPNRMNTKIPKGWINAFSLTLALLPLLNVYSLSFMAGISLGMIAAVFYSVLGLALLAKFRSVNKKTIFPIWLVVLYSTLTLIVALTSASTEIENTNMLYALAKLSTWAMLISFSSYYLLDYRLFVLYLYRIAMVATSFIYFESAAIYLLGWSVPNAIEIGPIVPNYADYQNIVADRTSSQVRLSSFWVEPAQYGTFILLVITILLFDKAIQIRAPRLTMLFLSLGVLLSTSTASIYLTILVLMIYFSQKFRKTTLLVFYSLFIVLLIAPLAFSFSFDSLEPLKELGVLGNSVYSALIKLVYWESSARLGSSFDAMAVMLEYDISKYVGLGMGNEGILLSDLGRDFYYLNSVAKTAIGVGYIGVAAYVMFYVYNVFKFKVSLLSCVLLSICFLGGFYSGLWYSPDSILYYCAAFYLPLRKSV